MNFSQGHSGTKIQCESCLFSQGKTPEFTKMGEIHELFVLPLSLVWFAGATPDHFRVFRQTPSWSHTRELDKYLIRAISVRFGPFRSGSVRFGRILASLGVLDGVGAGVGERGFCKGRDCHYLRDPMGRPLKST